MSEENKPRFQTMVDTEVPEEFRGFPCFDIAEETEFMTFQKGVKTFHRWAQHGKTEEIRKFSNENPNKDFYIHHAGKFIKINRSKK